jgi:MoxR-like ATPase
MNLTDPSKIYEEVRRTSSIISTNWKSFSLPHSALIAFSDRWKEVIGYPFKVGNGVNRLYTSDSASELVCDSDLALGICTYPFRELLWSFKKEILNLVNENNIATFSQDFASKPQGQPPNWIKYEAAIDKSGHDDAVKSLLKQFLCNPDVFYKIKGISRDDFDCPPLCYSINKRVDRFSICTQIASCVNYEIYNSLMRHVEGLVGSNSIESIGLPMKFNTPLAQSLLTKPFAILTGASGTGKTRLAESLAKHYTGGDESRYSVVAVGADWTDSRHVLGFVNHLRPVITAEGELPLYQSTPVLDLLLRATAAENLPHFLVLDEMNLSHVERYFADFLSAMERPKGALELHSSGSNELTRLPRFKDDDTGVPRRLPFPRNLFVIGTVNVDETTYMFSPKVLDRANVIEFRMSPQDLANFLSGDGSYPEAGEASASELQAFLALAKEKELEALPVMDEVKTHLAAIFSLMEKARFEFGYRAASEVIRYLKICRHLSDEKAAWDENGWVADLDTQILQKLLPRLHGGMGRMGPLLTGLGHLCHGTQVPPPARLDSLASLDGDGLFPRSLRKIRSMANVLRDEQFVSFIC